MSGGLRGSIPLFPPRIGDPDLATGKLAASPIKGGVVDGDVSIGLSPLHRLAPAALPERCLWAGIVLVNQLNVVYGKQVSLSGRPRGGRS